MSNHFFKSAEGSHNLRKAGQFCFCLSKVKNSHCTCAHRVCIKIFISVLLIKITVFHRVNGFLSKT